MIEEWIILIIAVSLIFTFFLFVTIKQRNKAKNQSILTLNQIESILKKTRPYDQYDKYLDKSNYNELRIELKEMFESISFFVDEVLRGNPIYKEYLSVQKKWKAYNFQEIQNQYYIQSRLNNQEIKEMFDDFNFVSLDYEQRIAVLSDERAALVVAAAGSGKTLTIAAKVAYLVKFQNVEPSKILLITFTKKACEEMGNRVSKAIGKKVYVHTFHELGLSILTEKLGYKPSVVSDDYLDNIIRDYIKKDLIKDPYVMSVFIQLFAYYSSEYKDAEEYESRSEFVNEMKSKDLETLKSKCYEDKDERKTLHGEKVKSLAELQIANFLFIHGIDYQYEENYQYNTATVHHRQYKPDFYLPSFNIYIEHYGVDEGNRARWLSTSEERKYQKGMEWKRSIHKIYNTKCLETFGYMAKKGTLLLDLEEMLKNENVTFKQIDNQLIINQLVEQNAKYFSEFQKLMKTFILLLKESGKSDINYDFLIDKLNTKYKINKIRARLFLKLIYPVFEKYQNHLRENNEIDFADMINQASEYLVNHQSTIYDYVIVDEYQDISESKSKLIDTIIKNTKAKLFCVGDDWQSIFRFAGSDIYQFTSFQERYESSIIQKIQKTYRNPQELVDISSKFIMRNDAQISKKILSTRQYKEPLHLYAQENESIVNIINSIIDQIKSMNDVHEILILGRYNFDLENKELYEVRKNHLDINIDFSTVHKAKGLESEHIIIINNKNHVLGFPSRIADDEILTMVLSHQDAFLYSEERRLFYVALTRAKYTCHLVVQPNQSIFIEELKREKKNIVLHDIVKNEDNFPCPRCDGYLVKRVGYDNDEFYGCSNYPYCEFSAPKEINFNKRCSNCGDYMIKRSGPRGMFWGCNSYSELGCKGESYIEGEDSK